VKASELRQLSREELLAELASQREGLFRLRFRRVSSEAAVANEFTRLRREIARILTILREQELGEPAETEGEGAEDHHG